MIAEFSWDQFIFLWEAARWTVLLSVLAFVRPGADGLSLRIADRFALG
ncbi:hypothetical protein [Herbaspirillum lusitanum]|nr:hypothetical protein [Herbaspirillum lusitanum]